MKARMLMGAALVLGTLVSTGLASAEPRPYHVGTGLGNSGVMVCVWEGNACPRQAHTINLNPHLPLTVVPAVAGG